ncbi:MAG TPA: V-type ATP synthase subunit B [Acidimicrobiales bacterium]|nr:V-type ATP synthase subunit B [Acidimicrobiales bacterium]
MSSSFLAPVEYRGADSASGPLLVVSGVSGVGWDEVVEVRPAGGAVRHGVVLEVQRDLAVVQVFEGTAGIDPASVGTVFSGAPFTVPVGPAWLGRTCTGLGRPLDGGPPVLSGASRAVNGVPMNPTAREAPRDPVVTGISAIDVFTTLVRGQKLPIFSVGGLPHLTLAAQLASQAHAGGEPFAVVFAGMGLTKADAAEVRDVLEGRAEAGELAMFINTAADPVIERILTPRVALTVAEHLAFEEGRHVLVVMADMTSYCEAVREVSAARGEVPGRRAYPGYLYSDLASLYERCGRMRDRPGSLTLVPVLSMPAGDITHPVPDLTGYITDGQVVLSAELHRAGIYPPVDELSSLSRLMRHGAGPGRTREDHLEVAAQLVAAQARARDARDLGELVGQAALTGTDRCYLSFADRVESEVISQSPVESRPIDRSLDLAWRALAGLPRQELTMISTALVDRHLSEQDG